MDPFLSTQVCVDRLLKEYTVHGKLIVAFDFDDTVFDFHKQGRTYDVVISILKRCQDLNFWLVIFTGCPPDEYPAQVEYMASRGIVVHSVNKNPVDMPFGNHGKIYANIFLDDRAGLGQACYILSEVIAAIERNK